MFRHQTLYWPNWVSSLTRPSPVLLLSRCQRCRVFLLNETKTLPARLAPMTIMSFLCRLFPLRCEPPKAQETAAPTTSADLGQTEAKNEALREEQLRHMEGGGPAQRTKPKKRL